MGWKEVQPDPRIVSKQQGDRVEQLDNFRRGGAHDHIVSNDGLNANFVRINGEIVVDDRRPDPYGG
jgi:hypothetical protein